MTPRISRLVLTSHITFSVGWLGAVAVFLALAITGLTTVNPQLAQSTYLAMEVSTECIIVPFCFASLLTGIIQALGTKWGLFKHYWIVVKLFLTFLMTVLLMLHLQPISYLAGVASEASFYNTNQAVSVIDLIKKAGAALLGLLATTTISIYKPWGKILYKQQANEQANKKKPARFYVLIGGMCLIILLVILHLLGGGLGKH